MFFVCLEHKESNSGKCYLPLSGIQSIYIEELGLARETFDVHDWLFTKEFLNKLQSLEGNDCLLNDLLNSGKSWKDTIMIIAKKHNLEPEYCKQEPVPPYQKRFDEILDLIRSGKGSQDDVVSWIKEYDALKAAYRKKK